MPSVLYLASNNRHKLEELQAICRTFLPETSFRLAKDLDPAIDWDETGDTFEANARIKADVVHAAVRAKGLKAAVLADDSGLMVDALGGAPGVYSARYAGAQGDDQANNAKLLAELASTPNEKRTGRFVCVLHYIDEDGSHQSHRGECEGTILRAPRGGKGFGYDPLFKVQGASVSFAELSAEAKNEVSHRRRALDRWLSGIRRL